MTVVAEILPLALVMVAGPQIMSSIFFATSEGWRRTSAAYVLGAALSISIVVSLSFLVSEDVADRGVSANTIYYCVLVLLAVGMLHTFLTRKTAKPPKWMGELQGASPGFAFLLGFLLLGVFPSDLVTSWSVGSFLSVEGSPLWYYLGFLAFTLLLLALPALLVAIMGERAEAFLPKVRDWMQAKSWIVSEIVFALFIVIVINSITGG